MTTPTNPKPREVLQCDWDRVADYVAVRNSAYWRTVKEGGEIYLNHLAQAFAAHRQAAEASADYSDEISPDQMKAIRKLVNARGEASAQPGEREAIVLLREVDATARIPQGRISSKRVEIPATLAYRIKEALRAPRADIVEGEG